MACSVSSTCIPALPSDNRSFHPRSPSPPAKLFSHSSFIPSPCHCPLPCLRDSPLPLSLLNPQRTCCCVRTLTHSSLPSLATLLCPSDFNHCSLARHPLSTYIITETVHAAPVFFSLVAHPSLILTSAPTGLTSLSPRSLMVASDTSCLCLNVFPPVFPPFSLSILLSCVFVPATMTATVQPLQGLLALL
ncbi:hypothetical protein BDW22DRAFT_1192579 [Trametopsis cervina]|nr:hypothetical protein BDW22DRAFT_1192579 [Trametopsis cervina]